MLNHPGKMRLFFIDYVLQQLLEIKIHLNCVVQKIKKRKCKKNHGGTIMNCDLMSQHVECFEHRCKLMTTELWSHLIKPGDLLASLNVMKDVP